MGCDIHSFAEVKKNGKWIKIKKSIFPDYDTHKQVEPFGWRSYAMFGFLAGVRNYSHCEPLSEPKGLPKDSEWLNSLSKHYLPEEKITIASDLYEDSFYHSFSYLTLDELLSFDYKRKFVDLRDKSQPIITYREYLHKDFFDVIEVLKTLGNPDEVRVIFMFDN